MGRKTVGLFLALILTFTLAGCGDSGGQSSLYAQADNWAYLETDKAADADVFFICPTVYAGGEDSCNMSMDDETTKGDFLGNFDSALEWRVSSFDFTLCLSCEPIPDRFIVFLGAGIDLSLIHI